MSDQQKRTRSIYMTFEAYRMLGKLAEEWKISENQATERAIREAHRDLVQEETPFEPDREYEDLRDQVVYLREQLRTRDEEMRRRDHILAASLERIPAISSKTEESETTGADLRASEEDPKGRGHGDSSDKPWWKLWSL